MIDEFLMSRPALEVPQPVVNYSIGFSGLRHPVGSEERWLREKTDLKRLTFGEFLRDHQPSRKQTDSALAQNSWRINRWDLDRPLLDPFAKLIVNGVIKADFKVIEGVAIQEAAGFLAPNMVEEARETADLIYNPGVAVFNGAKGKNEQNGIYTLRRAAEKEPTDIEIYAAKAATIIEKALIILGIDSTPGDFPLSQEMTQLINGLERKPVEQAMELIAEQMNESSKKITDIFALKQWGDGDLAFFRRLTHGYMFAQEIDGQKILEKTVHRNNLNYPEEAFSRLMLDYVISLGVDVHLTKNALQGVFKEMRYLTMPESEMTYLEAYRREMSLNAEAVEVVNWLSDNLPDNLREKINFMLNGMSKVSNGLVYVNSRGS